MKKNLESYPLILFIFLSLLTALSYVMHELQWRSSFNPSVHIPGALLLVFHIGMHLRVVQIRNQRHGILLYLLIQAAVVAAVACISLNAGLLVLLTVWLCGEEVGVSSDLIQALRNVGFYILGFLFLIFLLYDTVSALTWIGAALPTVVFALIAIFLYSSERKAREQAQLLANELREANIQLSDYSSQIAELTRQNERRRFARDLHDTLAQGAAGTIIKLETIAAYLNTGKHSRAADLVQQTMAQARKDLAEARLVIDKLRSLSREESDLDGNIK